MQFSRLLERSQPPEIVDREQVIHEIQAYHRHEVALSDVQIDRLMGLNFMTTELYLDRGELYKRYGLEQYIYEGTPYTYVRRFLRVLEPTEDDIMYDLGCGYGRVVTYAALTTHATVKGVEIVPERVAVAEQIRERLDIRNADFSRANVLDVDFSDGTIFFLFNPFLDTTLRQVANELFLLSREKPIKIVIWGGGINQHFAGYDWLKEIPLGIVDGRTDYRRLRAYMSI